MTTKEIYTRYDVPQNLQLHMLRVAGLAEELKAHWKGIAIDWQVVTRAALLHDLANVVKFDLVKFPHLLGEQEFKRVDYWRNKQRELIAIYGEDEHAAADKMLGELRVSERVRHVIDSKTFGKAKELNVSSDMEAKILLYCDSRIMPDGLATLQARLEDVRVRLPKYSSRPDFPELVEASKQIEQTILANLDAHVETFVTKSTIDQHTKALLELQIS